jgi:hypothetical protein
MPAVTRLVIACLVNYQDDIYEYQDRMKHASWVPIMRERLLHEEYVNWKSNPSSKYDST